MNGSFVVSILSGITAVMAVALIVASILRRRRAATRHALLTAAFVVALVLPVAAALAPYVTIQVQVHAPAVIADAMESFDDVFATAPANPAPLPSDRTATIQRAAGMSLATIFTSIWILGCAACLAPVAIGLFQMRSLRSRGLPWRHGRALTDALASSLGLRRRVGVVLDESVSGPMTCGTLRPTIVMPLDAETWSEAALTRAIVHELEHIRRADWLTQCLARTLCAVYWFHPLVWIARRQLVLEAERASDDAVLRYAEASAYADQLVDLARRLSAGHQPLLAMANRRDLAARVHALLDGGQPRGRAGAWLVAGLSGVAALLVVVMSPMRVVANAQQSGRSGERPRFDVVSVKPCDPSVPTPGGRSMVPPGMSPGHFFLNCRAVNTMILDAYMTFADGRYNHSSQMPTFDLFNVGPEWVRTERWTIEATSATTSPISVMQGPMLQAVLEDRFRLKVHRETREVPVLELIVAKGGPKITPFKPGTCVPWDYNVYPPAPLEAGQRRCTASNLRNPDGVGYVQNVEAMTLDDWVVRDSHILPGLRPPIVNKTGITGLQTFRFVYSGSDDDFPREIKEQLGLELRPGRAQREFLILDHVERPTPDGLPLADRVAAAGRSGR